MNEFKCHQNYHRKPIILELDKPLRRSWSAPSVCPTRPGEVRTRRPVQLSARVARGELGDERVVQGLHVLGRQLEIDWMTWNRYANRNSGWWDPVVEHEVELRHAYVTEAAFKAAWPDPVEVDGVDADVLGWIA